MARQALALAIAVVAFGFLGANDYADALILDAIQKEARPARAIAIDRSLPFAFPLDYNAVVCQRQYYAERARCRFYTVERTQ